MIRISALTGKMLAAGVCIAALQSNVLCATALAAELVMMQQKGCAWCLRWHREIGETYPKTEQGRKAPLRVVDIHEKWPADLAGIAREAFTPTFVLIEDGKEIGRIRGYAGDEFFWFLLDEQLAKLPLPEHINSQPTIDG